MSANLNVASSWRNLTCRKLVVTTDGIARGARATVAADVATLVADVTAVALNRNRAAVGVTRTAGRGIATAATVAVAAPSISRLSLAAITSIVCCVEQKKKRLIRMGIRV